jgi:hypothetical protein
MRQTLIFLRIKDDKIVYLMILYGEGKTKTEK